MNSAKTRNQIVVAKNILVPMRDGVGLATNVYRPAHEGECEPLF